MAKPPILPDVSERFLKYYLIQLKNSYSNFGIYVKELSDMDERAEVLLEYIISVYRDILLVKLIVTQP